MGIYVDQMFNETTARTSETQMLAGTGTAAGKYSPLYKGKLIKITIFVTPQAATSLCGCAVVQYLTAKYRPGMYADYVLNLYENGVAFMSGLGQILSRELLRIGAQVP